jgi:hypothetical protein
LITVPTFTTSAYSPPLQEQHRRAARVIRENTAFARDFVQASAPRKGYYEASAAISIADPPAHHIWCRQPLDRD